jgi:hypothetical protein
MTAIAAVLVVLVDLVHHHHLLHQLALATISYSRMLTDVSVLAVASAGTFVNTVTLYTVTV